MIAIIACGVFHDELPHFAAQSPQVAMTVELKQGLHNTPDLLRAEVQQTIDRIEAERPDITAIALFYGLCARGCEHLQVTRCTLVLPRAHDCITLFLGSKERYQTIQEEHPGTYWYSPGWNATGTQPGPDRDTWNRARFAPLCEDEEDLADMLAEEQLWMRHYRRAAYTDLGAGDGAAACHYAASCAQHCGWEFAEEPGDDALVRALFAGDWDDDRFCVCRPGQRIRFTGDARIVEAVTIDDL